MHRQHDRSGRVKLHRGTANWPATVAATLLVTVFATTSGLAARQKKSSYVAAMSDCLQESLGHQPQAQEWVLLLKRTRKWKISANGVST